MSKATATILRNGATITLTAQPRGAINTDHFAPRLRQALDRRGMKQIDLGKKAGINPQVVSNSVRGVNAPTLKIAARYAEVLGVSLDWLAGRENE